MNLPVATGLSFSANPGFGGRRGLPRACAAGGNPPKGRNPQVLYPSGRPKLSAMALTAACFRENRSTAFLAPSRGQPERAESVARTGCRAVRAAASRSSTTRPVLRPAARWRGQGSLRSLLKERAETFVFGQDDLLGQDVDFRQGGLALVRVAGVRAVLVQP